MADEMVAIVDESNNVVGSAPRSRMRAERLPHRACYVLVLNSRAELFVQKRTRVKDIYPGYYDLSTGGVVLAGESFDRSAARELAEELGVSGVTLDPLFEFSRRDSANRVFGKAYRCRWDGPVVLQQEEVESGSFLSLADVAGLAGREPVTPDSLYILARYLRESDRENYRLFERLEKGD